MEHKYVLGYLGAMRSEEQRRLNSGMWSDEELDNHEPLKRNSFELLDPEDGPQEYVCVAIEYQIDDVLRQSQRDKFFKRLEHSKLVCKRARMDLESARSNQDIDLILIWVQAFDDGMPTWMQVGYQTHCVGLTPMAYARTILKGAVYKARRRMAS